MELIRLLNMTPEVYTLESRDFLLLCRLYDCIFNCVKFDIDTVLNIIDTSKCRTNMLLLLATKLGFFTTNKYDDDTLRYILSGFQDMIRYKGSLKSIEIATNIFLKTQGLNSKIYINYDHETHTQEIGIYSKITDITVLKDLLRYILPFGTNCKVMINTSSNAENLTFLTSNIVKIMNEKTNLNSKLAGINRGNKDPKDGSYTDILKDKYINQIGMVKLVGNNTNLEDQTPQKTITVKD